MICNSAWTTAQFTITTYQQPRENGGHIEFAFDSYRSEDYVQYRILRLKQNTRVLGSQLFHLPNKMVLQFALYYQYVTNYYTSTNCIGTLL